MLIGLAIGLYLCAVIIVAIWHATAGDGDWRLPLNPRWPLMWTVVAVALSPLVLLPWFAVKAVIRLYQPTSRDEVDE